MRDTIKSLYQIDPKVMIKYSDKVYKIKCDDHDYCLKYVDQIDDGKIQERINALALQSFILPMKTSIRTNTAYKDNKLFSISSWVDEDYIESKDLKLKYYLSRIGQMHKKTMFSSNVTSSFFKEVVMQIEEKQQETFQQLDFLMSKIERKDYKSPFEWYYSLNFYLMIESLDKSKQKLEQFKTLIKDKNIIRQVITHQNFSYDHIFISKDKIIGNDKMKIASPIYEIVSLFSKTYFGSVDLSGCLDEYLKEFSLEDYEKEWLLSLLYIPSIYSIQKNDFKNMTNTMQNIFKYRSVCELDEKIHR